MNSDFEALGRYTHYKELAEAHMTGMATGLDGIKDLIERSERCIDAFNLDRMLSLLVLVGRSCEHLKPLIAKANEAAQICGRPMIGRSLA